MLPMAIRGIGPVGAFGAGPAAWREALAGIRESPPAPVAVESRAGKRIWPVFLAPTDALNDMLPGRARRRLDHFSRLALLGAGLALEDAGETGIPGTRTAIIVASAFGSAATTFAFLDTVIDNGDQCASPTLFSGSVHNAAAARIAMSYQLAGPSLSLTQFENSFTMALQTAGLWLAEGRVDAVLCGAVDEYCEVMGYCRQVCTPRDRDFTGPGYDPFSDGPAPAEGAVFFYLAKPGESEKSRYGVLERILQNSPPPATDQLRLWGIFPSGNPGKSANATPAIRENIITIDHLIGTFPNPTAFDLATLCLVPGDQVSCKTLKNGAKAPDSGCRRRSLQKIFSYRNTEQGSTGFEIIR